MPKTARSGPEYKIRSCELKNTHVSTCQRKMLLKFTIQFGT